MSRHARTVQSPFERGLADAEQVSDLPVRVAAVGANEASLPCPGWVRAGDPAENYEPAASTAHAMRMQRTGDDVTERDMINAIWPLFGLVISTPRLELRVSAGEDLAELAQAARSIQPPNEPRFQVSWMYDPSPQMERQFLQHYWRGLTNWRPDNWHLRFVVYCDDRPIGMQSMWAEDYGGVRLVETGSWIALKYHGNGYGTEMRAGVLELAFAHLGALEAHMDYFDGNVKAAAVSRKLGYEANGQRLVTKDEGNALRRYMRLDRARWHKYRMPGCVVHHLEPCLDLFGANPGE